MSRAESARRPGEVRPGPAAVREGAGDPPPPARATTTPTPPQATTTWRITSTPRGSTPQAQPLFEKALEIHRRLLDRRPPRHRLQLQQRGFQPQRPGEVRPGPAAVREGPGDPPPPAHRRPPRHRQKLQQPGEEPQRPGEVPQAQPLFEKALEIRRRLLTDDHPDTADSYNNVAANLEPRGSTPRPSRCSRRRWRSTAAC